MQNIRPLLILQIISFWPVWKWYFYRMTDSSDEPWGILSLLTALMFIFKYGKPQHIKSTNMILSCLFTAGYIFTYGVFPPLIRAMLAVLTISFTLVCMFDNSRIYLSLIALLILSLPVIASLQFYAGFPVRVFTSWFAAKLICLTGYPVNPVGASLEWLGEIFSVDVPCSGIKMLWTGLYLNFTLACFHQFGVTKTWLSYTFAVTSIFLGNILRTTLLFYQEAGIVQLHHSFHMIIGLVIFFMVSVSIYQFHVILRDHSRCA